MVPSISGSNPLFKNVYNRHRRMDHDRDKDQETGKIVSKETEQEVQG